MTHPVKITTLDHALRSLPSLSCLLYTREKYGSRPLWLDAIIRRFMTSGDDRNVLSGGSNRNHCRPLIRQKFNYHRDSARCGCSSPQPKSIIYPKSSVQPTSIKCTYTVLIYHY